MKIVFHEGAGHVTPLIYSNLEYMPRFRLDGKVALVTGGGSGIGAAVCRAYAEQGARVLVADINSINGESVAREIGEAGAFHRTDVTDLQSVREAVSEAVQRFGRLDIFV